MLRSIEISFSLSCFKLEHTKLCIWLVSESLGKEALKRILCTCICFYAVKIYKYVQCGMFVYFMEGFVWIFSVMASSWTSVARLWRGLLCSIFPACMAAPTCGERPRSAVTTTAWVRNYLKGCVSAPSLMPRNLNSVCKVSLSLGPYQSQLHFIWENLYLYKSSRSPLTPLKLSIFTVGVRLR